VVGKYYGTGNLSSDLRTWLSAIHVNTGTCVNGLEETNDQIKDKVFMKIDEVDSLVNDLLTNVKVQTISGRSANKGSFPSWVKPSVQKLLLKNAEQSFDVVVAADGTGNFTKVMDAVNAAPDSGMKQYVILIKKGVYKEIVEVNKMNIMMIGEGMYATIITGNLSNGTNHLATFQTATFGKSTQTLQILFIFPLFLCKYMYAFIFMSSGD
jgi:pectinesterase